MAVASRRRSSSARSDWWTRHWRRSWAFGTCPCALVKLGTRPRLTVEFCSPAHYRPPFGDYDEDNLRVLASRNYSVVPLWDLVAGSGTGTSIPLTQQRYTEAAATYPTPHMALSHEQDVSAADYLPGVVRQLTQAGYRLVTVAECIGVPAYQWVGEPQERDVSRSELAAALAKSKHADCVAVRFRKHGRARTSQVQARHRGSAV